MNLIFLIFLEKYNNKMSSIRELLDSGKDLRFFSLRNSRNFNSFNFLNSSIYEYIIIVVYVYAPNG